MVLRSMHELVSRARPFHSLQSFGWTAWKGLVHCLPCFCSCVQNHMHPLSSGYNLNVILRIQKSRDKMANDGSSCIACGGKAE